MILVLDTGPAGDDHRSATQDAISSGRTLRHPHTAQQSVILETFSQFKRISWSQRSSHSSSLKSMENKDKPEWTNVFFFPFYF